ncbi:MAG: hypothetical protein RLZZ161_1137, partial [Bacteroidota bacterium]
GGATTPKVPARFAGRDFWRITYGDPNVLRGATTPKVPARFAGRDFWRITYGDPNVLRGGYNPKSPGSLRSPVIFLCPQPQSGALVAGIKKSRTLVRDFWCCAQDWIRTSTPFPALPPQGSASTNFATWAFERN